MNKIDTSSLNLETIEEWSEDSGKDENVYTVKRLGKLSLELWDYSGIHYSNTVSKNISLISVGFFGPGNEEAAMYNVNLILEKFQNKEEIACHSAKVKAKPDQIFYVDFGGESANLQSGIWYTLKFRLNGPSTLRSEECERFTFCSEGDVEFDFFIGSQQMPTMTFKLL